MKPLRWYWHRYRYWLSALLLVPSIWYTYTAFNPTFPASWEQRAVGPFTATLTPLNEAAPYPHGDGYMKDFAVTLCEGCWRQIRSAHLAVGVAPQPLSPELDGLLHGGVHLQHVHAPFPRQPQPAERLWLTIEDWQGARYHAAWTLAGRAVPAPEAAAATLAQAAGH